MIKLMVHQAEKNKMSKQQMLVKYFLYFMLYLIMTVFMLYVISTQYSTTSQIDWTLVIIYSFLAFLSYQFFMVNDINARKLNGRAMAMGLFLAYIGITLIASSFVYDIPGNWVWFTAGILLITGYLLSAFGMIKWARHHKEIKQVMLHESLTDELTGLFNRRAFAANSNKELAFSVQSQSDFSVIMIDIDDFKLINDRYGHAVGDEILIQMAAIINAYKIESDSVYRWGGEEFVVLMPITGLFEANKVANKMVAKIAESTFVVDELALKLTVSIGLAQWVHGESIVKDTLDRADKALYKAKATGKNAVVVADYKEDNHKPHVAEDKPQQISVNQ